MITTLAVLIGFGIILLCLRTVVYRFRVRKGYKNARNYGVMMSSFEQFKSLYEIAPDKYEALTRYLIRHDPHIIYTTKEKDLRMSRLAGVTYWTTVEYRLYFEDLSDFIKAQRLIERHDRRETNSQTEKEHIEAQKSFVEHVRCDLDIYEQEGVKEI